MTPRKEDVERYFRVLELGPGATPYEIRRAYERLTDLYSKDSAAVSSLTGEDFTEERKGGILGEIEEAYAMLTRNIEQPTPASAPGALVAGRQDEASRVDYYSGPALKFIREKLGVKLYEVELATKIRTGQLEDIEQERFDRLPEEVYVRGHLAAYAKRLSLDPARVVNDYMERYRHWRAGR